ncbi:hypothetical protein IP70_03815 [alpha proteobacterium AAP38]|nr:hypothetical protein IP70_03815 [alpha proteobacterium AAP38]
MHHGSQQEGGIGESFTGGIASLAPVTPGGSGAAPTGTATIGDFRQHLAIGTDVIADQGGAGMVDVGGGGGGFAQVTDTTPPSLADNGRPVTPTQSFVAQPGAGEAQTSSTPIRSAAAPAESTSFATPGPATTQTTGGETGTGTNTGSTGSTGTGTGTGSNTGSTGSTGAGLSAPSLTISSAIGLEDQPVSLSIAAGLVGAATGEVLAVTITGVPVGASLSGGTKNADGTWTVGQSLLSTLKITPPTNDSSDFQLGISVKILGITTQIGLLNVNVEGVADLPTVTFSAAAGTEDQGVALSLGGVLGDLDGSEALSFVVKCLSAGTNNGNGTWTLTAAQLTGLKLTPPANSDADFNLGVTAKVTGLAGIDSSVSAQLHVTVLPVADMPSLNVTAAVGVSGHGIPLNIQSALTDLDGSEALHVTIAGVPVGGLLSAGTDNHNGTWTLAPGDLPNLSLLAPDGSSGTVNLTVTATAVEGADNGRALLSANLSVAMTADTGALSDDILVASGMDLSLLGGQSVSRAIISLDPLDFHQGDSLSLAGLHQKTTATGKVISPAPISNCWMVASMAPAIR